MTDVDAGALEELEVLVTHGEVRLFTGHEDLARQSLVFFGAVPALVIDRREELLAGERGAPDWYLVTSSCPGTEFAKDLRALGVALVEVDDLEAARERLEAASPLSRTTPRQLESIPRLRASLAAARAGGAPLPWDVGDPVPDEQAVVELCFGGGAGR